MHRDDLTAAEIQEFVSRVKNLPGCLDIAQDEAEKAALLFLRARKRDVNRAVELYKANKRMRYTENVDSIDPLDEGVRKELLSGKFTVLSHTSEQDGDSGDDFGATVAIFTANRHWPPLTTHRDTLKGVLYQLDVAMMNEQSQRRGLVVLYDMRDAKYANFDYHLCIKLLNLFKGVYPVRLRKVIIVEPPIWFRAPFGVLRLFVKEKMRDRISTVDMDELHVHLPSSVIHKVFQQLTEHRHLDWLKTCLEKTGHATQLPEDYFVTPSPTYRSLTSSDLASYRFGRYGSLRHRQSNRSHDFEDRFGTTQGLVGHRYSTLASPNAPLTSAILRRDSRNRDRMLSSMYGIIHNSTAGGQLTTVSSKEAINSGSVRISNARQRNNSCIRSFSPASTTGLAIPSNETSPSSQTRLIVPEFIHRVQTLGALGLCAEFEAMFKDQPIRGSFDQFMLSQNRRRNRYLDVPCLDSSAVELSDGTYLHANWVHGYRSPRAYILAQGPLDNTRRDFWLAVWEHRVPVIVMLTKIVEGQRIKCAPYWPSRASVGSSLSSGSSPFLFHPLRDSSSDISPTPTPAVSEDPLHQPPPTATYGEFHLVNLSEAMEHDGLYRRTRLEIRRKRACSPNGRISPMTSGNQNKDSSLVDSSTVFHVDHLLYLGWPDFDVPSDTEDFLTFLNEAKALHKARCEELCSMSNGELDSQPICSRSFPLLIHCSAGIGRTGTFVTVDICLQQALNEGYIDVPDVINRLREQRAGAVQVPKQYAFVHSALASSLLKPHGAQY